MPSMLKVTACRDGVRHLRIERRTSAGINFERFERPHDSEQAAWACCDAARAAAVVVNNDEVHVCPRGESIAFLSWSDVRWTGSTARRGI